MHESLATDGVFSQQQFLIECMLFVLKTVQTVKAKVLILLFVLKTALIVKARHQTCNCTCTLAISQPRDKLGERTASHEWDIKQVTTKRAHK